MSDYWNPDWENPVPKEEQTPAEETKPEETTELNEETPAEAPQSAEPQQEPEQEVPYNGWNTDGSYRYVPPRSTQPTEPPADRREPASYRPYTASDYNTPPSYYQAPPPQHPKKNGNGWVVAIAVVGALVLIGSIVFLGLGYMYSTDSATSDKETASKVSSETEKENADAPQLSIEDWDDNDGGLSTREVVNRNLDSTVVLTMYSESTQYSFGGSSETEEGAASGIVMTKDGYIITNWHCVIDENTGKAYDRIDVTTYDGTVYENAQVVGADQTTDLAVVKIKAKKLTAAQFGDSSQLNVGDRVIALGNAAGLSWTATQGIVSALARDVYEDTGYSIKCLQTDAAINPGNSGGPLLNNQGLVVGINSSKIAATNYEGLGFAIPINEAKTIIDSLLKNGYVKGRVALGVRGQSISSGQYKGFLIASIDEGSSLNNSDVQVGDLIVAVDGETITDYGELRSALSKHSVGDKVTLTLLRSNRSGMVSSYDVKVTLQEQKSTS